MTYRLKFGEPAGRSWRRIAGEQIAMARDLLASGRDVDVAIHETRKAMKRVRALLRLLRPGLPGKVYKREKARYGDIARLLAGARDEAVLAATAHELSRQTMGKARIAAEALASNGLAVRHSGTESSLASVAVADQAAREVKAARVREAVAALDEAAQGLAALKVRQPAYQVVRQGLADSYGEGRRAMKRAYRDEEDEDFHDWRKAVQAHWRHMLLVARAWPELFEARAQLAKEMSDLLGEDHDLYVLIHSAEASEATGAAAAAHDGLVRAARARQAEIRNELHVKGKALFAETADRFIVRVDAYWNAAKAARKLARSNGARGADVIEVVAAAGGSGGKAGDGKSKGNGTRRGVRPAPRVGAAAVAKPERKSARTAQTKRRGKTAGKPKPQRAAAKPSVAKRSNRSAGKTLAAKRAATKRPGAKAAQARAGRTSKGSSRGSGRGRS